MKNMKSIGCLLMVFVLIAAFVLPTALSVSAVSAAGYAADNGTLSNSVEEKIKAALLNKTSYLFMISDDYTFMPGVKGSKAIHDMSGIAVHEQPIEWAQGLLKSHSSGYLIRIDNGKVSVGNKVDYTCSLKILENNKGISLNINSTNSPAVRVQILGTIKGNMLTASQEVILAYYSAYTLSGTSSSSFGRYSVGIAEVPKEQWPPIPVILSYSRNDDRSVTLTWKDNNPSGLVEYYEIYRKSGVGITEEYSKVATVSNGTAWTDSSDEVKVDSLFSNIFTYHVIAYSKTGIKSAQSNFIMF